MKFVDINGGRIWSVIYDGEDVDVLTHLFRKWSDLDFLENFFRNNSKDLASYFKLTRTMEERKHTLDELRE